MTLPDLIATLRSSQTSPGVAQRLPWTFKEHKDAPRGFPENSKRDKESPHSHPGDSKTKKGAQRTSQRPSNVTRSRPRATLEIQRAHLHFALGIAKTCTCIAFGDLARFGCHPNQLSDVTRSRPKASLEIQRAQRRPKGFPRDLQT